MIYLDGAATSRVLPCVKDAILDALDANYGNSSSLHSSGVSASQKIEEVRQKVADYIGATPEEIIFTSGATESNNTVMHIFEGKSIYISPYEHPSVAESAKFYSKNLSFLNPKENIASLNIPPDSLVSHQLSSNETGHLFDISSLTSSLKSLSSRTYFHTDATGAIGKTPVNVADLGVDYLTFSAHKLGGPLGIGVLYVKNSAPFTSLLFGGHQENNRRAGTLATPLILGLGAAIDYAVRKNTISAYETSVRPLKDFLASEIKRLIPHSIINSEIAKNKSLSSILNVSFPGAEGESVELALDLEKNIIVGTGSACASGEPSPTLLALSGGDPELSHSSIRFSLDLSTKKEDIVEIMQILPSIVKKYRAISTVKEPNVK